MRITEERIMSIAQDIVRQLIEEDYILLVTSNNDDHLEKIVAEVIQDEMEAEDRLDEEVKEIMLSHSEEMGQVDLNQGRMFQMIKRRLIREREIIL